MSIDRTHTLHTIELYCLHINHCCKIEFGTIYKTKCFEITGENSINLFKNFLQMFNVYKLCAASKCIEFSELWLSHDISFILYFKSSTLYIYGYDICVSFQEQRNTDLDFFLCYLHCVSLELRYGCVLVYALIRTFTRIFLFLCILQIELIHIPNYISMRLMSRYGEFMRNFCLHFDWKWMNITHSNRM